MRVLAHIREQYSLSLGSYGRPRMTMELKEAGLDVGERRVGRLMRINGIKPVRTRKQKVTTDSHHRLDEQRQPINQRACQAATGPVAKI